MGGIEKSFLSSLLTCWPGKVRGCEFNGGWGCVDRGLLLVDLGVNGWVSHNDIGAKYQLTSGYGGGSLLHAVGVCTSLLVIVAKIENDASVVISDGPV